jgi:predicted 3-demethylubiquinone-9 3-methyltransferase (glyoxalase superfamily)
MQKITPFLWFDGQAEEAVAFYLSVFKNAKAGNVMRSGEGGPGPKGSVLCASFELEGIEFTALNGGPHFKFNEAVSFLVQCADQAETDYYWGKLIEGGGEHSQCGWLKDRFGMSWQVTPTILLQRMSDPDPVKAGRVAQAMMKMTKIDIAAIEQAYAG